MIALLFSFGVSLLFSLLLRYSFKRKGPGPIQGLLFSFLVIFMFTLSVGSLLIPLEPTVWGFSWLSHLLVALLVTFLIGAMLPKTKPGKWIIDKDDLDRKVLHDQYLKSIDRTFSLFFWLLMFVLLLITIARYFIFP